MPRPMAERRSCSSRVASRFDDGSIEEALAAAAHRAALAELLLVQRDVALEQPAVVHARAPERGRGGAHGEPAAEHHEPRRVLAREPAHLLLHRGRGRGRGRRFFLDLLGVELELALFAAGEVGLDLVVGEAARANGEHVRARAQAEGLVERQFVGRAAVDHELGAVDAAHHGELVEALHHLGELGLGVFAIVGVERLGLGGERRLELVGRALPLLERDERVGVHAQDVAARVDGLGLLEQLERLLEIACFVRGEGLLRGLLGDRDLLRVLRAGGARQGHRREGEPERERAEAASWRGEGEGRLAQGASWWRVVRAVVAGSRSWSRSCGLVGARVGLNVANLARLAKPEAALARR
jgi:hypothetical protein